MRVGIVQFLGTHGAEAAERCFAELGCKTDMVWHTAAELQDMDLVVIPDGAAFGNYVRPGAIARLSPIREAVHAFAQKGGVVLGIGNGFHILTEWELLPGVLVANASLRYQCQRELVQVERADTVFTSGFACGEILEIPISTAYGCYQLPPEEMQELEQKGQVVFRYVNNPNGSAGAVAGIINTQRNVLGMLPQPERSADGMRLIRSIVQGLERRMRNGA